MDAAKLKLTDAGRAALIGADHTGTTTRKVTQVGFATAPFVPSATLPALPNERKRVETFAGDNVAPDTIHLTIRDDTADQFTLYGFGLYLDNGVLLGTYGQDTAIVEKSPLSILLLAADIIFAEIDAALLTFGNTNFINPPATTERQGVIELATDAETQAGTDAVRAVTPKSLTARTATEDRAGLIEIATQAETNAGTEDVRAVTPKKLAGPIKVVSDAAAAAQRTADAASVSAGAANSVIIGSTRETQPAPKDILAGVYFDLKLNTADALDDGGNYNSPITMRGYGSNTDFSGGLAYQLVVSDNGNLWTRNGGANGWNPWHKVWDSANFDPTTKFDKIGGAIAGLLTLNGVGGWTNVGWNRGAKFPPSTALEFAGPNTHFGIGNSGDTLYMFATTAEDNSAPANYFWQADAAGKIDFSQRPTAAGHAIWDSLNLPSPLSTTGGRTTGDTNYSTAAGVLALNGFLTGNNNRWRHGKEASAETGGNVGGNYAIYSYADDGTYLDQPFSIERSSSIVSFSKRPTFAGNLAWDEGNFNPANYMPMTGGTFINSIAASGVFSNTIFRTKAYNNDGLGFFEWGAQSWSNPAWRTYADGPTGDLIFTSYDVGTGANKAATFRLGYDNRFTFSARPTFNGATPWDNANLPNPATAGAQVQWNTGITEFGAVSTGESAGSADLPAPWVLVGLRNSFYTHYLRAVQLRNQ